MPLPPSMICGRCGYDRKSIYARDPYAPCPECGDDACPGRVEQWPPIASIVWQLVRVQAIAAAVAIVLAGGAFVGAKQGWSFFAAAMGGSSLIVGLLAAVLLVFWPISASVLISERYCLEVQRTAIQGVLLLSGWGASLVTALVFLFALWLLVFIIV